MFEWFIAGNIVFLLACYKQAFSKAKPEEFFWGWVISVLFWPIIVMLFLGVQFSKLGEDK